MKRERERENGKQIENEFFFFLPVMSAIVCIENLDSVSIIDKKLGPRLSVSDQRETAKAYPILFYFLSLFLYIHE